MDWKTWSPFQSADTRMICKHMNKKEKLSSMVRGGMYGIWCAITLAMPLSYAITIPSKLTIGIAIPLLLVHIAAIPIWLKQQKKFLCSTEWAKAQGYSSDQMSLFGLKWQS